MTNMVLPLVITIIIAITGQQIINNQLLPLLPLMIITIIVDYYLWTIIVDYYVWAIIVEYY